MPILLLLSTLLLLPLAAFGDGHGARLLSCSSTDKTRQCRVRCFVYWPDGRDQKVFDVNDVEAVSLQPMAAGSVLLSLKEYGGGKQSFLTSAETVCEFEQLGQ